MGARFCSGRATRRPSRKVRPAAREQKRAPTRGRLPIARMLVGTAMLRWTVGRPARWRGQVCEGREPSPRPSVSPSLHPSAPPSLCACAVHRRLSVLCVSVVNFRHNGTAAPNAARMCKVELSAAQNQLLDRGDPCDGRVAPGSRHHGGRREWSRRTTGRSGHCGPPCCGGRVASRRATRSWPGSWRCGRPVSSRTGICGPS